MSNPANHPIRCLAVGNPNCGKSTLFNALSGGNVSVGNWSGVTVDKKVAQINLEGLSVELTDLPGLFSLENGFEEGDSFTSDASLKGNIDEAISRQVIKTAQYDTIINIIDITQLERSLYLTTQLLELGVPVLVVLNKADVAKARKFSVDIDQLSEHLGCPVVAISAKRDGVLELRGQMAKLLPTLKAPAEFIVPLASEVEQGISKLGGGRADAITRIETESDEQAEQVSNQLHALELDLQQHIPEQRYRLIESFFVNTVSEAESKSLTDVLDRYALSPWTGVPIFLGMMYLTFMFAINVGAAFIDFFDIVAGNLFVDGAAELLGSIGAPHWMVALLARGVGVGIQTVATFIPVVAFLYIALSILEVSGYLARAGFVIEGLMQKIGLPGKAFVPLIVGFGCNVPSITATRTLDTQRERLVTALMAPFMSCGARLPVYALFVAAFFPENGQNLVFLLYLAGIVAAVLTGLLLRYTLLFGQASRGFTELPDYELPSLKEVMRRTWQRTRQFVLGAGKIIVIVVTILSVVNTMGVDGSFGNEDSEKSLLSHASQIVTPVFAPIGIQPDNWPATVGIVTGIFAKEAVVGTLNSLYGSEAGEDEGRAPLLEALNEGLATIPENMLGITWDDPLGLDLGDTTDTVALVEELDVEGSTLQNLQARFVTGAAAFAYLLFILLYTPCAAVLGAFAGEFGSRWATFCAVYTFGLAYSVATLFYQLSQLSITPFKSFSIIAFVIALLSCAVFALRHQGQKPKRGVGDIPVLVQE